MTAQHKLSSAENPGVSSPIRVLLVDDSKVVRSIFARVLADSMQVMIVGEAASSAEAIAILKRQSADIVLLDIEMPERTGLEALPDILDEAKGARVLVVSAFAEENGPAAIKALSLGACDTLAKPGRFGFSGKFSEILVEKVVRLGRSRKPHKGLSPQTATAQFKKSDSDFSPPDCIAIGASTGGIPVIYDIIRNLPDALTCPVFVTQHLPHAFMEFFARQLQAQTSRAVRVSVAGELVSPNTVYISPGDVHLVCRRTAAGVWIDHLEDYSKSRYSPSVDALLESVGQTYGAGALGLVLSGMGNDGAFGAAEIARLQGKIIVQDEESSVVWGMPGAIVRAGLADAIMPPAHLTRFLARLGEV
jgi:two-component system, chemotaxis family, protein-glutamate methylesterase/glutaminase